MFKCVECDRVFDEPICWKEGRGEYWGEPCYEGVAGCPYCKGGFEEAEQCAVCGEWFYLHELQGGVCEECINEHSDFDTCYDIGDDNPQNISINGFLAYFFDKAEIEDILKNILFESGVKYSEYADVDRDWFGEQIIMKRRDDK